MNSNPKGKALENAVRAIETCIVHTTPGLREATFRIEARKVVKVGGVRHEVDLWVQSDAGHGYDSLFLFECKNRKVSVGKNDIVAFSEKIRVLGAQRGFFVAPSFTRDATAQAANDGRISLLKASQLDGADLAGSFRVDVNWTEGARVDIRFHTDGTVERNARVLLRGMEMDVNHFAEEWMLDLIRPRCDRLQATSPGNGPYRILVAGGRRMEPGEMEVDGRPISGATIQVDAPVWIFRPAVLSRFDIESRGRAITFEDVEIGGMKIQATFAESAPVEG